MFGFCFTCVSGYGIITFKQRIYEYPIFEGVNMGSIVGFIVCIILVILIEVSYNSYLDKLPKDKQDELIKKQTEMRCSYCSSTDFEVAGMKHGRLKFQCKRCKRMR